MNELRTANQIVMERVKRIIDPERIPPITAELGRYWNQPERTEILIDAKNAVMDKRSFDMLAEYSTSIPTGVYPGKMWKRNSGGNWFLVWFGECEDPNRCSINHRAILMI